MSDPEVQKSEEYTKEVVIGGEIIIISDDGSATYYPEDSEMTGWRDAWLDTFEE